MPLDLWDRTVVVSGGFPDYTQAELEVLLLARGARVVPTVARHVDALYPLGDPDTAKVARAKQLGVPIVDADGLREALGPILHDYPARMRRAVTRWNWKIHVHVAEPPADAATLARAAAIHPALAAFYAHHDGLSLLWTTERPQAAPIRPDTAIRWSEGISYDGEMWREIRSRVAKAGRRGLSFGLVCIPPLATVLDGPWDGMLYRSADVSGRVKVGKRQLNAAGFYRGLRLFDACDPNHMAMLHLEADRASILYGSDAGACYTDFHPVQVEVYLESLAWLLGSEHIAQIVSKLGATTSYRQVRGQPFPTLRHT